MKKVFSIIFALFLLQNLCAQPAGLLQKKHSEDNKITETEKFFKKLGFVNIKDVCGQIVVDLKYSTNDNFTKHAIYNDINNAYLHVDAAQRLALAQRLLNERYPGYSLIVYDALRTQNAQEKMWDVVKGTKMQKYVSSPKSVSNHSYGIAVDVSIVDKNGVALDMGTSFDYFDELSQPKYEKRFLSEGKLSQKQVNNRLLLRNIMKRAGFMYISNEWWHFELMRKTRARTKYKPVKIPTLHK